MSEAHIDLIDKKTMAGLLLTPDFYLQASVSILISRLRLLDFEIIGVMPICLSKPDISLLHHERISFPRDPGPSTSWLSFRNLSQGPSLYLLLQRIEAASPLDDAQSYLSSGKGASRRASRDGSSLRDCSIHADKSFSYMHCPDHFDDLVRELALFDIKPASPVNGHPKTCNEVVVLLESLAKPLPEFRDFNVFNALIELFDRLGKVDWRLPERMFNGILPSIDIDLTVEIDRCCKFLDSEEMQLRKCASATCMEMGERRSPRRLKHLAAWRRVVSVMEEVRSTRNLTARLMNEMFDASVQLGFPLGDWHLARLEQLAIFYAGGV